MSGTHPPAPRPPRTVAFIGTGSMGMPLIERLLENGYGLRLHDKNNSNAKRLSGGAITWCGTPREAAKGADTVVTCLPLPHHVLENMLGENGALGGMKPGATWIDTSTTDYHNTLRIAAIAREKGVWSLEAPVSNLSHMGVDFANVCFYVGGELEAYEANRGLIDAMGRKSFHVGDITDGQTVKLFTNLLFYTALVVWGDLMIVGRRHDLPLKWLWNHARRSAAGCFVVDQLTPFILDGSYDHSCTMEIGVKDTDLVVRLAEEENCPAPIGTVIRDRYVAAGRRYHGRENHVLVVQLSEDESGFRLQLPGFCAPSPYGKDRSFVRSSRMLVDDHGRTKPFLDDAFFDDVTVTDARRHAVSYALVEFMALVNFRILKETRELARRKGLNDELITEVVRWSCGPSFVGDNEDDFVVSTGCVCAVADLADGLNLSTLERLVSLLKTTAADLPARTAPSVVVPH